MIPFQILIIILGILPSLVWLIFYLKEDENPEPILWLFLAYLAGMGAVAVVFAIEYGLAKISPIFAITPIPIGALNLTIAFVMINSAFIEEGIKFLAAYTLLKKNPVLEEAIDAMIYLITVSLGFAALENILMLNSLEKSKIWQEGIATLFMRLIGANLLHTLSSGIVGFGWAMAMLNKKISKKIRYFVAYFIFASLLHALFNIMIVRFGVYYIFPVTLMLFAAGLYVLREFDILKTIKQPLNN
jgi:RsiW-degrading membrane proteinase PrsW (M82 family)